MEGDDCKTQEAVSERPCGLKEGLGMGERSRLLTPLMGWVALALVVFLSLPGVVSQRDVVDSRKTTTPVHFELIPGLVRKDFEITLY